MRAPGGEGLIMVSIKLSPRLYRALSTFFAMLAALQVMVILSPAVQAYPETPPMEPASFPGYSGDLNLRLESVYQVSIAGRIVEANRYSFSLTPDDPACRIYIDVMEVGGGGWVLLFHGLGGDGSFWVKGEGGKVTATLVGMGLNVAIPDLAGHGDSCIPGGESWKDLAKSFSSPEGFFLYYVYLSGLRSVEALRALGADNISVVGVSLGGMTALVVASLHPQVGRAVSIYATGCITCMIASGGLANFLGDPQKGLDDAQTLDAIASLDPLNYLRFGEVKGKVVWIVMPSHDEYFPLEALLVTSEILKAQGARYGFTIVPNGDHYLSPTWLPELVADVVSGRVPSGEGGESYYWRPATKGLSYLTAPLSAGAIPWVFVTPVEVIENSGEPPVTTEFRMTSILLSLVLIVIWLGAAILAALAGYVSKPWLPPAFSIAFAVVVSLLPVAAWEGRFSLSLLEAAERYGVTMYATIGVPSHYLITLGALAAPALLAGVTGAKDRVTVVGLSIAYLAALAALIVPVRLTLATVASRAEAEGFESGMTFYPVEVVLILFLLGALYARRKIASSGWR
ncbi:MAG: alpha/beta hydrolase [Desulfurococcales archaeon]|nr:alpha/beta hydrolase [Desulfurococcales archaeon]